MTVAPYIGPRCFEHPDARCIEARCVECGRKVGRPVRACPGCGYTSCPGCHGEDLDPLAGGSTPSYATTEGDLTVVPVAAGSGLDASTSARPPANTSSGPWSASAGANTRAEPESPRAAGASPDRALIERPSVGAGRSMSTHNEGGSTRV